MLIEPRIATLNRAPFARHPRALQHLVPQIQPARIALCRTCVGIDDWLPSGSDRLRDWRMTFYQPGCIALAKRVSSVTGKKAFR